MFVANVKMLQLTHILIYNRVWNYNCTFVFQAFGPIVKHQHYCENTVYSLCKNVSCGVVPPSLRFGNFLHYCDIHGTLLLQIIGPLHQETIPDSGQERRQSQDGGRQRWPRPVAVEGDLRGGTWHWRTGTGPRSTTSGTSTTQTRRPRHCWRLVALRTGVGNEARNVR